MAKSKNHTNHNQNRKDHRNGIFRPKRHVKESMKGRTYTERVFTPNVILWQTLSAQLYITLHQ
ncbi:unnamed protein product, partial [Medioppia subpectinata]